MGQTNRNGKLGRNHQQNTEARQMTDAEQTRLACAAYVASEHLGRSISYNEMLMVGIHPHEREVFFFIEEKLKTATVIRSEAGGHNMVVALYPDMTSIQGKKGLLVLGREFTNQATHKQVADLIEGDWDLNKEFSMKKGA